MTAGTETLGDSGMPGGSAGEVATAGGGDGCNGNWLGDWL